MRALAPELARRADAVIVSAFGDPGADELGRSLRRPVVGIAEAGMRAAAAKDVASPSSRTRAAW